MKTISKGLKKPISNEFVKGFSIKPPATDFSQSIKEKHQQRFTNRLPCCPITATLRNYKSPTI